MACQTDSNSTRQPRPRSPDSSTRRGPPTRSAPGGRNLLAVPAPAQDNRSVSPGGAVSEWFSGVRDNLRSNRIEGLTRGMKFVSAASWIAITYQLTPLKNKSTQFRDEEEHRLNKKAAEQALDLILSMKGYYIKAAQTLCGAGQFPEEFDDAFGVLLDQCPKEPYDVVKRIVEEELNCKLESVFQSFDQEAIAAASIGQVHFAVLKDGTEVAVKVQYPEVERYFKMDVQTVSFAMGLIGMGSKVREVFKTMEEQFAQEFDYTKESVIMKQVADNIMPHFGSQVVIPLPIDESHPSIRGMGIRSLCTRKVLTMERLDGVPIRKHIQPLLEMFAQMHGTTADELKKQMQCKDPTKIDTENSAVKAALKMGEISEGKSRMLIIAVKVRNLAGRLVGKCCTCSGESPKWAKAPMAVPLNGPKLAKLLFEVHGHEIFQNGLFNSDPHAGNVLMMPDGRLGLIDYGAVMKLSKDLRTNIAKMMVAIADEDDRNVAPAFWACGFKSKNQDPRLALLLAHVFFNRGPFPYDMNRLAPKVGMPKDADIMTLDKYIRGGKIDDIVEFPGHMVMLQRCCMVLSGIGMEMGAGRLSSANMLKPQALKWLRGDRLGKAPTNTKTHL